MAVSKYKLAEQCISILGAARHSWQEIMTAVTQSLARVVKAEFFAGKEDGVTEINGAFIYSFNDVAVSLDASRNRYFSLVPANYINLPHDYGVVSISKMKADDYPFVRLGTGQSALFNGLDADGMEGRQTYFVEGGRIYYPRLVAADNIDAVLIRLAVSLDGIDDDTNINIPNDVQEAVINMVVTRYGVAINKERGN